MRRSEVDGRTGAFVVVTITDFGSISHALRWRREARGALGEVAGLVFAKPLLQLAGARTFGLGVGAPHLGRQVTLTVWRDRQSAEGFTAHPLGRALSHRGRSGWSVQSVVSSSRGSFYGKNPLEPQACHEHGPMAVVTLGRSGPGQLPRFVRHGARLTSRILEAPGLITAVSAGWPPTGNMTFSIWSSERAMLDFAYGQDTDGHRDTATASPPILREQLNMRLVPVAIDAPPDTKGIYLPERVEHLATQLVTRQKGDL